MKKWFVFALVIGVASLVRAQGEGGGPGTGGGPGDGGSKGGPPKVEKGKMPPRSITKEQFIAFQKRMAERRGTKFDQSAAEARFNKMDKNKDGVLSGDELPRPPRGRRGPRGPITKAQFIEQQKKMAERRGEDFVQADAEAMFNKLDKNKDGVLTGDELRARWQERREGRKGDKDADKSSEKKQDQDQGQDQD